MLPNPKRKNKNGRTILEETDINCFDTIELEEAFVDMQILINNLFKDIRTTDLDTASINNIYTLQEICISILERIKDKLN